MGKGVWIGEGVFIENEHPERVELQEGCVLSIPSMIIAHTRGQGSVVIGRYAHIGPNVIISCSSGRTIRIGDGAVISTGAIISRSVAPQMIVAPPKSTPVAIATIPFGLAESIEEFISGLKPLPGIGLALAKELVDLHRGTITVESTPGKGSVFSVTLPIARTAYRTDEISESPRETEPEKPIASGTAQAQPEHLPAATPTEGKPIVLIVEDYPDLRRYIREYLEPQYAVQEARNGKEGCDQAFEIIPDIVVSDIMMPGMDGLELCQALKQDERTSHVPIVLLTARAGTDSKVEGLEIGADDYLTKPFEMKKLLARIRNLIELRRKLRERYKTPILLRPGEVTARSDEDVFIGKVMKTVEEHMRRGPGQSAGRAGGVI